MAGRHHLLLYPALDGVAEAWPIWSFSYGTHFPNALLRLASRLRAAGDRVTLVDAFQPAAGRVGEAPLVRKAPLGPPADGQTRDVRRFGLTRDELARTLAGLPPVDEAWVSSIFTWSWPTTHEAAELVRAAHPAARVRLGGVYPTLCPEHAAGSGVDLVHAGPLPEIEELPPDLSLPGVPDRRVSVLKTSVGCPNGCRYCAVHRLEGRRMRYRDPGGVEAEVRSLHARFGTAEFHFWESNLLLRAEAHFLPLLDRLAATGLPLSFIAPEGVQPDLVTPEVAAGLARAGFRNVYLTLETTDREWAARVGRPVRDPGHLLTAVRRLAEAGIPPARVIVILLIGQPGQQRRTVLQDILCVLAAGCAPLLLCYTPIPGSADYAGDLARLGGSRPLEDLDPLLFPFAHGGLSVRDLDRLLRYFTLRAWPLERIRVSRTDDDLIREMQGLLAAGDYLGAGRGDG